MLDAIEEQMKQDDETTASQLVKMLGKCGFKISTRTGESQEDTSPWSTEELQWHNCSDKWVNSNTFTIFREVRRSHHPEFCMYILFSE